MAHNPYEDEIIISWVELHRDARYLSQVLHEKGPWKGIVAVTRGGLVPAALIARELDIRLVDTVCVTSYDSGEPGAAAQLQGEVEVLKGSIAGDGAGWLLIDDLVDTGRTAQIVGLRYFNVYGEREAHKGRMASVAHHFFHQYRGADHVRLFTGSGGFGDGEQRRDFVSVGDCVKVNLFFLDHPEKSGIFNVGTGAAQSFNDVAAATVNACRKAKGESPLTLLAMRERSIIQYIPFPEDLKGRYQSYTQADISALRAAGYDAPFLTVEQGVTRYCQKLLARG